MTRYITIAAVCALASGLLVSPARAQCPTGFNPLQALVGTWTFSTQGFASTAPLASTGRFTASIGTDRSGTSVQGLLSITRTLNQNGLTVQQETDTGRYTVLPDCSGGSLILNLSSGPLQFDFWFSGTSILPFPPGCALFGPSIKGVSLGGQTLGFDANLIFCPPPPPTSRTCSCPGVPLSVTITCPLGRTPVCNSDAALGSCLVGTCSTAPPIPASFAYGGCQ